MGLFSRAKRDPEVAFADQVMERVKRAGVAEAWIDRESFAIRYRREGDTEPGWIYLSNTYQECQGQDRGFTRHRIDTLVQAVVNRPELPDTWAQARPALRPVIRTVTFALGTRPDAPAPMARPAFAFLQEMVVVDTPNSMAYVLSSNAGDWGVSEAEVFAAARENLAAIAAQDAVPIDTSTRRIVRFMDDGNSYFVSRLLLDGWLAGFATAFGGRILAFVPDNNTLIISTEAEESMPALMELVEKDYLEAPRSISPQAYTVDVDASVVEFPVIEGHPAAARVHRAATLLASSEYAAQKHWIDQRHEKEGTDIFVASCTALERPDGSLFSVATWSRDVDTLLPRADYVALVQDEAVNFFITWASLAEHVPLTAADGLQPERYRLTSWPDQSTVERLRAVAVAP